MPRKSTSAGRKAYLKRRRECNLCRTKSGRFKACKKGERRAKN